jgi:hypothetical protein
MLLASFINDKETIMMSHEHHAEPIALWALRSLIVGNTDSLEESRPIGNREFAFSLSMVSVALVALGLFYRLF